MHGLSASPGVPAPGFFCALRARTEDTSRSKRT
jgi:hypothetical protein